MTKHKWAREIHAWADGAEIEARTTNTDGTLTEWQFMKSPHWESSVEYRIKPQSKEPQYLYVYKQLNEIMFWDSKTLATGYIGKIKLEVEDHD